MTDTYHIQVGHTIFWWNVPREKAEELVRYYEGLYPDKEIQMIKNKEKL